MLFTGQSLRLSPRALHRPEVLSITIPRALIRYGREEPDPLVLPTTSGLGTGIGEWPPLRGVPTLNSKPMKTTPLNSSQTIQKSRNNSTEETLLDMPPKKVETRLELNFAVIKSNTATRPRLQKK